MAPARGSEAESAAGKTPSPIGTKAGPARRAGSGGTDARQAAPASGEPSRWTLPRGAKVLGRLVGFGLLASPALAIVAAVVLLPEYAAWRADAYQRDLVAAQTADLKSLRDAQERMVVAAYNDPVYIKRLAMWNCNLWPTDEQVLDFGPADGNSGAGGAGTPGDLGPAGAGAVSGARAGGARPADGRGPVGRGAGAVASGGRGAAASPAAGRAGGATPGGRAADPQGVVRAPDAPAPGIIVGAQHPRPAKPDDALLRAAAKIADNPAKDNAPLRRGLLIVAAGLLLFAVLLFGPSPRRGLTGRPA
jgi:hypothetical protein